MGKINADEILQRGIELMKEKRFKEAEKEFKRIDQGDNAQYLRAQYYLIDIYFINKRWIEVIKASEWILENHCSDISKKEELKVRFRLGRSYFLQKRWGDAAGIFNYIIKKRDCKFYDAAQIELARVYISLNQPQKSVKLFLQVSYGKQKLFSRARYRLGMLCLKKGLGMRAIKAFESISDKDYILYSDSRIKLGLLYLRANQNKKAFNILQKIS